MYPRDGIVVNSTTNRVYVESCLTNLLFVIDPATTTTATGSNVTVQADLATTTFTGVTQAGATTLTTSGSGQPPPSGFGVGQPPTYYDLSTTAVFSGPVTVRFNYSGISYGNESGLKLYHLESGAWVDRTVSLDITNKMICGSVTSLSPFAVFSSMYVAHVQQPINADGSSVFNAKRGVVPVSSA